MSSVEQETLRFEAPLLRPHDPGGDPDWGFVLLPVQVSERLPRRGRTSVRCLIGACGFDATLEPDGRLGHWLRLPQDVLQAAGVAVGSTVAVAIVPLGTEPEPALPPDFAQALSACPAARLVWQDTTTIARVDWIHWVESAKQAKTRAKRIGDACEMLASGKRRVCCFDPSGFYSKALSAPRAAK
jgi:hypothetical protein